MKEFNLERALAGDSVMTRDCSKAEILRRFAYYEGGEESLAVLITRADGQQLLEYRMNGECSIYGESMRLFMKSKKVTRWYNIYKSGPGNFFSSEDDAKKGCCSNYYIETRSIVFEE